MAESSRNGIFSTQANHGFARGSAVRFDGANWVLAVSSAGDVGLVGSLVDANTFEFVTHGELDGLSGLTPGAAYYVINGELTTEQSGLTIGTALSNTSLLVNTAGGSAGNGGTITVIGSVINTSQFASQIQLTTEANARLEGDEILDAKIALANDDITALEGRMDAAESIISDGDKGDITLSSVGTVWTVDNDAVTNAKAADMPAGTLKGNDTGGTADPADLTATQVKTLLAISTSDVSGAVATSRSINTTSPLTGGGDLSADRTLDFDQTIDLDNNARVGVRKNSGGSTFTRRRTNFIEGSNITLTVADDSGDEEVDVTIAASTGGVSDGDKGDITVSGSGATWAINNDAVSFAKIQNIATGKILGRTTALSGDIEELTPGDGIGMSPGVLYFNGAHLSKVITSARISITSTTTATINRLHVVSGTSADYTITLPSSPVDGEVIGFYVKDFAAASKQYTLDAGGTVKIAGRTRYLTLVHTNVVWLEWDGTDWQPMALELDTPWVDAGAITVTAVTTNPTKGTSTTDVHYWRRVGDSCEVRFYWRQTTAGTNGSGAYRVAIPFAYDTARVGNRQAEGTDSATSRVASLGLGELATLGTTDSVGIMFAHTTNNTTLAVATTNHNGGAAYVWGSGAFGMGTANINFHGWVTYPVTDW